MSGSQPGHRTRQPEDYPDAPNRPQDLRQEVAEGLLYAHSQPNASKMLENAYIVRRSENARRTENRGGSQPIQSHN